MTQLNCPNHFNQPGIWECDYCNRMFCEKCIHLSETEFGKVFGLSTERLEKAKERNKKLICNSCYFEKRINYVKTIIGILCALLIFEILAFIYSFLEDENYRNEWTMPLFALTLLGIFGGLGYWWLLLQKRRSISVGDE
ncbi:MAG: hypothetical protein ACFFAE_21410 [Candidatus Hodarchaeota archaeon]